MRLQGLFLVWARVTRQGILVVASMLAVGTGLQARAAEVSIVQPAAEATVHSNRGDVQVEVRIANAGAGSRVRLRVDGAVQPVAGGGTRFGLQGLERGAHVIEAELIGADGVVLARSQSVTFHVWQASRLNPHRGK